MSTSPVSEKWIFWVNEKWVLNERQPSYDIEDRNENRYFRQNTRIQQLIFDLPQMMEILQWNICIFIKKWKLILRIKFYYVHHKLKTMACFKVISRFFPSISFKVHLINTTQRKYSESFRFNVGRNFSDFHLDKHKCAYFGLHSNLHSISGRDVISGLREKVSAKKQKKESSALWI